MLPSLKLVPEVGTAETGLQCLGFCLASPEAFCISQKSLQSCASQQLHVSAAADTTGHSISGAFHTNAAGLPDVILAEL